MNGWRRWIGGFLTGALTMFLWVGVLPDLEAQQDGSALDTLQRRITFLEERNQQDFQAIRDLYQRVDQVDQRVTTVQQTLNARLDQMTYQANTFQHQVGSWMQSRQQSINQIQRQVEERERRSNVLVYPYVHQGIPLRDGRQPIQQHESSR